MAAKDAHAFQTSSQIVIAGGGLNGPVLALALADVGFSVTIVDARPADLRSLPDFDGRAYALAKASEKLLSAVHIWPDVAAHAAPILEVKASDGRVGHGVAPFFLHYDCDMLEDKPLGYVLEERYLYRALLTRVRDHANIQLISGETVVGQQNKGAAGITVELASGALIAAQVLVGCDGRGSSVAQRAGIRRQGWSYEQTALVCAIAHEKPHQSIAHQFFTPSGPLAILPLPGGYHSSIVWSESTKTAQQINALNDADYLAALEFRIGTFLGQISLSGARFGYPLSLSLAESFIAPRVALVGDAAHGVHPIAGQGLNLGLRDVAALTEVLFEARGRGEDIGDPAVLGRYQSWRRAETLAMALGMDAVNKLFSNDNPLLRFTRDLGMGLISALPGVQRHLARQAAGVRGQNCTRMPRLLAGLPL